MRQMLYFMQIDSVLNESAPLRPGGMNISMLMLTVDAKHCGAALQHLVVKGLHYIVRLHNRLSS